MSVKELKQKIFDGNYISREEAISLLSEPLYELCKAADEIREKFCGNTFDMCTIINGKSGKCSENCKYCAQSSFYKTCVEEYPLLDTEKLLEQAVYNYNKGVLRYSVVCSGKKLSDKEVDSLCESIREIKKVCPVSICVSAGLLDRKNFQKLKDAGVDRVHNNLETSQRFFENVCTTHTFQDKIDSIKAAQLAGLEVCSGGIMGLGESMEDRIDMILKIRELGIKSVPVNLINPIPNTPFEKNKIPSYDEIKRITAVFRFLVPDGFIRLAGGRSLMPDKGAELFRSGANACISGDMLTTQGITIDNDMKTVSGFGYEVKYSERKNIFSFTGADMHGVTAGNGCARQY